MLFLLGAAIVVLLGAIALGAFIGLSRLRDRRRGYSITFHGRAGLTYEDYRGVVEVDGEMLSGPVNYVIDAGTMQLTKAKTATTIDDEWRAEIVRRIECEVGIGKLEVEGAKALGAQP